MDISDSTIDEIIRELELILPELHKSDREIVLIATAYLDDLLLRVLSNALPNQSNDELFDGTGPLSTFSARIMITYRLGMLDTRMHQALNLIRKVRNSFAHEIYNCTLTIPPHADRLRELMMVLQHDIIYQTLREKGIKGSGIHADFRAIVITLGIKLLAIKQCKLTPSMTVALIQSAFA